MTKSYEHNEKLLDLGLHSGNNGCRVPRIFKLYRCKRRLRFFITKFTPAIDSVFDSC